MRLTATSWSWGLGPPDSARRANCALWAWCEFSSLNARRRRAGFRVIVITPDSVFVTFTACCRVRVTPTNWCVRPGLGRPDPHGYDGYVAREERPSARHELLGCARHHVARGAAREWRSRAPRSARLVAGDRPPGVFTTGQLQQWVYGKGLPVGTRALVIGAEHVSFSAIMTLRHAHVKPVALVTDLEEHQSVAPFAFAARRFFGVPVWTSTRVVAINGQQRVREVVLEDVRTGAHRVEAVDVVVFSGDWIPDYELARRLGVELDAGTLGPASDDGGRTSVASFYAAGNLLHPVETADVAALRAREVARALVKDLANDSTSSSHDQIAVRVEAPLSWAWPNRFDPLSPVSRVALRAKTFSGSRLLVARQDGREIGRERVGLSCRTGRSASRGRSSPWRTLGADR